MEKTRQNRIQVNPAVVFLKNNMGILIALIGLCAVLTFATDSFMTPDNLLSVLRQICINAFLAIGMTFVLIIGGIDLTVGSVVASSGVAVVMFMEAGVAIAPAIILALLFGAAIGLINGTIIAFTGMPPFIVTLSMMGSLRGLAYLITDGRSVSCSNEVFRVIGNGYLWGVPIPIYILLAVVVVMSILLYKTKFGRRMYAVGGNATAARFTGIKIKSLTVRVYMISGILAALAGVVLASRMYSGQPSSGQNYEADAIAAAVLGGTSFNGGIGTIGGTIIGALVIGILANGLNLLHISSYVQQITKGVVIILAVGFDVLKNRKMARQ